MASYVERKAVRGFAHHCIELLALLKHSQIAVY